MLTHVRYFSVVMIALVSGCASSDSTGSGMAEAMKIQNAYASHITESQNDTIMLDDTYTQSLTRGVISTTYSIVIPNGEYTPVMSSAGRVFYEAPEGFEYRKGNAVQSRIGGLVQIEQGNDAKFYVWHLPKQLKYFEIEPNGGWLEDVKPGLSNIQSRPWVNDEFVIER